MKIAYVSCMELPEVDFDEKPLMGELLRAGYEAEVVGWDDPSVDWARFDVAIVRATWNYAHHVEEFEGWIDRVDGLTRLVNPLETMKWNLHKGYLQELSDGGVEIVPTAFVDRYMSVDVDEIARDEGWGKIVIKPTVSAGSFGTRVFDLDDGEIGDAQGFFDEMIAQRDMMIQKYIVSVDTVGETSLVVINGELTHGIEKRPRFDDQEEEVYLREEISDEMRSMVDLVLKCAGRDAYYARVDVIPDEEGAYMLSEVEMLEPSLFFPHCERAIGVFVDGLGKFES